MSWALFDGYGAPIGGTTVPLDGPNGVIHTRPVCHILYDFNEVRTRNDVDLIMVLPVDQGPHQIPDDHLARAVDVLDSGGSVAVHGSHNEAVADASNSIFSLCGGGRA